MVGRKRNVDLDIVKQIFEDNINEVVVDKKVVAPGNSIWKQIWEKLERKTSQKAIYNDALRWFEGKTQAKGNRQDDPNDEIDESDISIEQSSDASGSDGNYSSSENEEARNKDITFSISLSREVWQTIEPAPTEQKRSDSSYKTKTRVVYELKKGLWTNVLIDRISQHRIRNPCTWSFESGKVYPN